MSKVSVAKALQALPGASGNMLGNTPMSIWGTASPVVQSYQPWAFGYNVMPRTQHEFEQGAFGPLTPMQPAPINEPLESTGLSAPRRWQVMPGWNLPVGQPGTEGLKLVSFANLRAYADGYSVFRAAVEVRKNEILGIGWDITPTDAAAKAMRGNVAANKDFANRYQKVMAWFKNPDPANYFNWDSWFKACLEERFVTDALSLFLHPTKISGKGPMGSDLAALELIDGTTIRPLMNIRAERPHPPNVAFQQYLWGIPRSDMQTVISGADLDLMDGEEPVKEYTANQLLYLPFLPRAWTPYGFPPLERGILPTITGLKRQQYQLMWHTEGSIPGLFITPGPDVSTPAQIASLQEALNALAGDQSFKHQIIVLPPGSKADPQKPNPLSDQTDEVIISEALMAIDVNPEEVNMSPRVSAVMSPAVGKQMAQANAPGAPQRISLKPELSSWKGVFDYVLQVVFDQDDMQFTWDNTTPEDDEGSEVPWAVQEISFGMRSIDEWRVKLGLQPWNVPITSDPIFVNPTTGPQKLADIDAAGKAQPVQMPANMQQQVPVQGDVAPQLQGQGAKPNPPRPTGAVADSQPPKPIPASSQNPIAVSHNMVAELEKLRRYIKRGRSIDAWRPEYIPAEEFDNLRYDIINSHKPNEVISKAKHDLIADGQRARREQVVAPMQVMMSRQLSSYVRKLQHGNISTPAFMDSAKQTLSTHIKAARQAGMADALTYPATQLPNGWAATPGFEDAVVNDPGDGAADVQGGFWTNKLTQALSGASVPLMAAGIAMYGAVLASQYEQGFGMTQMAANPDVEITWNNDGGEICDLCEDRDGKVYTMQTLPGFPGDGGFGDLCEGGMNCKCTLTYSQGGKDVGGFENTGRDQSIGDFAAAQSTLGGIEDDVNQARSEFLAGIQDPSSSNNAFLDSVAQSLADQQSYEAQNAPRPLDPETQAARGTWALDVDPQDIVDSLQDGATSPDITKLVSNPDLYKDSSYGEEGAQALRDWYNNGADGAINWGEAGDFDACVAIAGKYIDNPEGYCNLRHQDATGAPPGHAPGEEKDDVELASLEKYNPNWPDEPRNDRGEWTVGGDSGGSSGTDTTPTAGASLTDDQIHSATYIWTHINRFTEAEREGQATQSEFPKYLGFSHQLENQLTGTNYPINPRSPLQKAGAASADDFITGLNTLSTTQDGELFRGVLVSGDYQTQLDSLSAGDTLDIPISSFTKNPDTAVAFSTSSQVSGERVVFTVDPGSTGWDISGLSGLPEDEVVSGGRYSVTGVESNTWGIRVIHLSQQQYKASVSAPELTKDYQDAYMSEDRDGKGQWTSGGSSNTPSSVASNLANGQTETVEPKVLPDVLKSIQSSGVPVDLHNLTVTGQENSTLFNKCTLCVPRDQMPVIRNNDDVNMLAKSLQDQGVVSTQTTVDPRLLTATQSQIDGLKVSAIVDKIVSQGYQDDQMLVVAQDGSILDGHHRWAAWAAIAATAPPPSPSPEVPILWCATSINNLMSAGKAQDESLGIHTQSFGAKVMKSLDAPKGKPATFGKPTSPCPDPSKPYLWVNGKWILIATDAGDGVPDKLDFPATKCDVPDLSKYSADEPRGSDGRWVSGGSAVAAPSQVSDAAVSTALAGLKGDNPGFTVRPDGTVPTTGYAVGGLRDTLTSTPQAVTDPDAMKTALQSVVDQHPALFDNPTVGIGGWVDGQGNLVIEPSENIQNHDDAFSASQDRNQEGMYGFGGDGYIDTGGTGEHMKDVEPGDWGKSNKVRVAWTTMPTNSANALGVGDVIEPDEYNVFIRKFAPPDGRSLVRILVPDELLERPDGKHYSLVAGTPLTVIESGETIALEAS